MSKAKRLCDVCRKEIGPDEGFAYEQKSTLVYGRIGAPSSQPTGRIVRTVYQHHDECARLVVS